MTEKLKTRSMPLFCCEEAADAAILPFRNLPSGRRVAYDPCTEDGKCDFCCKQIITWQEVPLRSLNDAGNRKESHDRES